MNRYCWICVIVSALLFSLSSISLGARLKDIAQVRGVRDNQLVGYGVVVGLSGTGDKSLDLTESSLSMVLKGLGVDPKSQKLDTKNAAAVVASATLPPFARIGSKIDITISSVGTAASLEGGTLLMTSLKGPDGIVYAMAQGKVMTDRKSEGGKGGSANLVTARVPNAAIIEKEIGFDFASQRELRLQLYHPDFTTAVRAAKRINDELSGKYATASDAGTVDIVLPYQYDGNPIELMAQIESLEIETDSKAKVVLNSKTGTVILGEQVRVAPVAIAHNNMKIEVKDPARATASEPGSEGEPAPTKTQRIMMMNTGTSIADIVTGLNEMGASSDELIALISALKTAGAIVAEVEIQ